MPTPDLNQARAFVADPEELFASDLRSKLEGRGFGTVRQTDDLVEIEAALSADDIDLLVVDVSVGEEAITRVFHDVRHHRLGNNPFVVLVATAHEPNSELVRSVIDGGSDDLIVKPVDADIVADRIEQLAVIRKKFVVTTDYVGPDRRKAPRPGAVEIPQFEVPNPLDAEQKKDAAAFQKAIDAMAAVLNEQKIIRHAHQIDFLANRIVTSVRVGEGLAENVDDVDRLVFVSEDIGRRLHATRFDHVGELCNSVREVAGRLLGMVEAPDFRDIRLLPELAAAVVKVCDDDNDTSAITRDITRSVGTRR